MGTANQFQSIQVHKLVRNSRAKEPTGASRANGPRLNVFRIGPHQITKGAFVRYLLVALDCTDLIKGPNWGREATMNTQDLAVNKLQIK